MNILPNISIKQVRGIEWNEDNDSKIQLAVCHLEQQRNTIELVEQQAFSSFEKFVDDIKTSIPIVINFTGKGVLSKIIQGHLEPNETTLQMLLPHATMEDFYLQIVPIDDLSVVSIIRRTKVDEVLLKFGENKFRIIDLFFGPSSLWMLQNVLEEEVIFSRDYSFCYSPEIELQKEITPNKNYTFGEKNIDQNQVSAFGAALSIWFQKDEALRVFPTAIDNRLEEEKQRKLFKLIGVSALVIFFFGMAINLFVFQNLAKDVASLQQKTYMNKGFLLQMDSLNDELAIKEKLASSTGIKNPSQITFYADKIAASVPSNVKLQAMAINENKKKVNPGKRIVFIEKDIRISGNSKTSIELNEWINRLEELDFTKHVSLNNYIGSGRLKGDFEINIVVN